MSETFSEKLSHSKKESWKSEDYRKKQYENNPVLRGEMTGENNPMYGQGDKIRGEKNGMYGKKHTEETLSKMRKPKSSETRSKMSESRKGKIWITDGTQMKFIKEEELVNYPGFVKGRVLKKESK